MEPLTFFFFICERMDLHFETQTPSSTPFLPLRAQTHSSAMTGNNTETLFIDV